MPEAPPINAAPVLPPARKPTTGNAPKPSARSVAISRERERRRVHGVERGEDRTERHDEGDDAGEEADLLDGTAWSGC
jgi:hypothetical protein